MARTPSSKQTFEGETWLGNDSSSEIGFIIGLASTYRQKPAIPIVSSVFLLMPYIITELMQVSGILIADWATLIGTEATFRDF